MSKKRSATYTVLTCLLLGPLVGLVVLMATIPFDSVVLENVHPLQVVESNGGGNSLLILPLFVLLFAYMSGGLQALLGGMTLATYGWFRGGPPWWVAGLAGLVISAITMAIQNSLSSFDILVFLVVHLSAALVCWYATKRFWAVPI